MSSQVARMRGPSTCSPLPGASSPGLMAVSSDNPAGFEVPLNVSRPQAITALMALIVRVAIIALGIPTHARTHARNSMLGSPC